MTSIPASRSTPQRFAQIRVRVTPAIVDACNDVDAWMQAHRRDVDAWLADHLNHPLRAAIAELKADGDAEGVTWDAVLAGVRAIGKAARPARPRPVEVSYVHGSAPLRPGVAVYSVDPHDPGEAERGRKSARNRARARARARHVFAERGGTKS